MEYVKNLGFRDPIQEFVGVANDDVILLNKFWIRFATPMRPPIKVLFLNL